MVNQRKSTIDENTLIVEVGSKTYHLILQPFDGIIDTDDMLKIDYSNIVGELLTFPVLFNRVGILKAEIDSLVAEDKFDCQTYEAQLQEEYRKKLTADGSKTTEAQITNCVLTDGNFRVRKKNYFKLLKHQGILDALYWSAKSKDDKLNKIADKLRPEEFEKELLEDTVNGVLIKRVKSVI